MNENLYNHHNMLLVKLYDHGPHVHYFFCLLVALWTILSLVPTTSHPKAIGGVCLGTITDILLAL